LAYGRAASASALDTLDEEDRCHQERPSVTAGTIFDRSRVPLADWFTAICSMTNQKYGISTPALQRLLGLGS
jgi:hypothetical protein